MDCSQIDENVTQKLVESYNHISVETNKKNAHIFNYVVKWPIIHEYYPKRL